MVSCVHPWTNEEVVNTARKASRHELSIAAKNRESVDR
jgi:isopentenyldiphosphate isomerase